MREFLLNLCFFDYQIPVADFLSYIYGLNENILIPNKDRFENEDWILSVPEDQREDAKKQYSQIKKYENYKTDVNLSDLSKSFYVEVQKIKGGAVIDTMYSDLFEIDRKFCNLNQTVWSNRCNFTE